MVTTVSLVTICHHTNCSIIGCCPYSVHYILMTYFIAGSLSLLLFLTYVTHPLPLLPIANHQFVLCIYESVFVLLCLFICFVF